MSKSIRQENLYGAEDWSLVYTTFKNAEFASYDFDTLRNAMIQYLQANYPEEFNDYIQSSEFVALIDLVAYVGQNLSFRMDLNARENILDTAEKRESVLRIARMLSYKPKRVRPSQGLLKIVSVNTTEQILDSTGANLANQNIFWGADPSELEYERFIKVLNSAFNRLNQFGTPVQRTSNPETGVSYEVYNFDNADPLISYPISAAADGLNLNFDLLPVRLDDTGAITQKEPDFASAFSTLYRNDGKGVGSTKTGFFILAKQGFLQSNIVDLTTPSANLVIDIYSTSDISEEDYYLQTVNENGDILASWKRVSTLDYTNLVVNEYGNTEKNVYEVIYSDADTTSIKFGDGDFTNAPSGRIRYWYRQSQNAYVRVKAGDIVGANFQISYKDDNDKLQTLYMTLDLQENMITGLPAETLDEIKRNAPEAFYSKNRMVTAEDYNGFIRSLNSDVLLLKSENRTFSGHTRYVDLKDPTGKSRPLVEFADDGYLYKEEVVDSTYVADNYSIRLVDLLDEYIERQLSSVGLLDFYYAKLDLNGTSNSDTFPTIKLGETIYKTLLAVPITSTGTPAVIEATSINTADPYDSFDIDGGLLSINGEVFSYKRIENNKFIEITRTSYGAGRQNHAANSLIYKLDDYRWRVAYSDVMGSNGYISLSNNDATPQKLGFTTAGPLRNIRPGALLKLVAEDASYEWVSIVDIKGDGLGIEDPNGDYTGRLVSGNGVIEISKSITGTPLLREILPAFPRIFDDTTRAGIIEKLDLKQSFGLKFNNILPVWSIIDIDQIDLNSEYDNSSDASAWLIVVQREETGWTIITRQLEYVFGSDNLMRFYNINYLPSFNDSIKKRSNDDIHLLSLVNNKFNTVLKCNITGYYVYDDGYTDPSKVKVTLIDVNGDMLPDDPEGFDNFVQNSNIDLVEYEEGDFTYLVPVETADTDAVIRTVSGKMHLPFKWVHRTPVDQALDPSLTNIIDVYVLTKSYNSDFVTWKRRNNPMVSMPLPQTSEELRASFRNLGIFKMMTDEIIFHPAKFKPLFGLLAEPEFQAQFKVVKNPRSKLTDNEIKSKVVHAIDKFFEPGNFNFGEIFYFTELAAYVHNQLNSDLNSVVIVPISVDGRFGTLFQIQPDRDEVVTSVATVNDVIVINEITDTNIRIGR